MSTETKLPPTIPKAAGAANAQNLNHAIGRGECAR
jgi:hypothetical protein